MNHYSLPPQETLIGTFGALGMPKNNEVNYWSTHSPFRETSMQARKKVRELISLVI